MCIDAYNQIQQIYESSKVKKTEAPKTTKASFKDQLMLSSLGIDAQLAKQKVANTPDIREEIVGPLKEQIDNGTYDVSAEEFAGKLLERYSGLF